MSIAEIHVVGVEWLQQLQKFFAIFHPLPPMNVIAPTQNYPPGWLFTGRVLGVHCHHLQQHSAVHHGYCEGDEHSQHWLRGPCPTGKEDDKKAHHTTKHHKPIRGSTAVTRKLKNTDLAVLLILWRMSSTEMSLLLDQLIMLFWGST